MRLAANTRELTQSEIDDLMATLARSGAPRLMWPSVIELVDRIAFNHASRVQWRGVVTPL